MKLKKDLKNLIVSDQASINSVLELLDNTGKGCLLVTKSDGFLIGTITDGDVRRKLIQGKSIRDKIESIYNREPKFFIDNEYNKDDAKKLMLDSKINLIPIINKHGLLVNYITLEDILTNEGQKYLNLLVILLIRMTLLINMD